VALLGVVIAPPVQPVHGGNEATSNRHAVRNRLPAILAAVIRQADGTVAGGGIRPLILGVGVVAVVAAQRRQGDHPRRWEPDFPAAVGFQADVVVAGLVLLYEIAIEEGVKFLVYGNLDYGLKKSGYDSRFRTGHYDGKGRVGEWILFQNQVNKGRMGAAVFTTGPYIEMAIAPRTPMTPTVEDGVVTWRVPLGEGAVPHVSLEDCGFYVRWLFDHPERASGMDLEVAVDHIAYVDLAAAFEKITGHPARYIDTDLETYWKNGPLSPLAHAPAGYNADPNDKSTMSIRGNFTGF
jgi:NmrA-like family